MIKYNDVLNYWQKNKLESASDVDLLLHNFRILFAYNSNKIENEVITYHDTREIFENGKILNFTGDIRTVFEIQNQKECYDFLRDKIASKEQVSLKLIKDIHLKLTNGTYDERRFALGEHPGEFKAHDYITGKNEVGSPPETVEEDLDLLLTDILNSEHSPKYNALIVATYLHASFEYIHPFADGNGRVGRTLLNYYLMTHNYPPLIVFDEDKKDYYTALEKYDTDEALDDLIEFFKQQTIKTWCGSIDRNSNYIDRSKALASACDKNEDDDILPAPDSGRK